MALNKKAPDNAGALARMETAGSHQYFAINGAPQLKR